MNRLIREEEMHIQHYKGESETSHWLNQSGQRVISAKFAAREVEILKKISEQENISLAAVIRHIVLPQLAVARAPESHTRIQQPPAVSAPGHVRTTDDR
jgi:hypothetical protein